MNPALIKTFAATGTIAARSVVKFGSNDGEIVAAAAATDSLLGVLVQPGGVVSGDRADVALTGTVDALAGGTITRGGLLSADASGRVIAAAPGAGTNHRLIGIALASAVVGDIIPILLSQGSLQG